MPTLALNCNNCGAPLSVPDGVRFLTCSFCQSQLEVVQEGNAAFTKVLEQLQERTEQVATDVRSFMGDRVFNTIIPRNVRISEAPSHGKPVLLYDVKSKGARAYAHLAGEMLRRERNAGQGNAA